MKSVLPRLLGMPKAILFTLLCLLTAMNLTAQSTTPASSPSKAQATFGGGCFWCVEAVFERLRGVESVVSGYAGGKTKNPTYDDICRGDTGHAEVVRITFDPSVITFGQLLEVFWEAHDPTTLNRQGADVGTQYRSVIFYHDEAQKQAALKSRDAASPKFSNPIVTEISPLPEFYTAERYHQDYFANNPYQPYCMVVISPKLRKLEKTPLFDSIKK